MRLDPVLLEILNNKAAAAADEMSFTLQRTGRTLYVKETADLASGLVDPEGRFFAYSKSVGVSHFMDLDCGPSIRAVPDLEPGDVIITNHPYRSEGLATHLPDLHMIRPYFHHGEIVCYGWCFIHSTDVGGKVPSSISPSNHEVFQEGLLIPPMKMVRRGELNPDFANLFTANCRTPDENMGDMRAMLAALHTGNERVADIISQHGLEIFRCCQIDLQDYAAAKAREVLRLIPDGVYEFWDYLDDDLVSNIPVRLRVRMTVSDGEVHLDFTGTDPQVAASFNMVTMGRRHAWLTVRLIAFILSNDKTVPLNAGLYRHISVTVPKGTLINPEFPAAVGVRHATGTRIMDLLTGAILKAGSDLISAPSASASTPVVFSEFVPESGKNNVLVAQMMVGGTGARKGADGADGRDSGIANLRNNPIESIEADAGLVVGEYAIRPDSGGPGEWRGGVGLMLTLEVQQDGCAILARGMERFRFQPWGVAGGLPGAPFRVVVNRGRADERRVGKIDLLEVDAGDTVTIMMPGGGGYGDPYRRDPELVLRDVRRGFVGLAAAASDYGVVIADDRVDEAATAELRENRVRDNMRADFNFGSEREAWEAVFDDAGVSAMIHRLFRLPRTARQGKRRRIYELTVPRLPVAGEASLTDALAHPDALRVRFAEAVDRVLGQAAEPAE